jgi:hypothetical protein
MRRTRSTGSKVGALAFQEDCPALRRHRFGKTCPTKIRRRTPLVHVWLARLLRHENDGHMSQSPAHGSNNTNCSPPSAPGRWARSPAPAALASHARLRSKSSRRRSPRSRRAGSPRTGSDERREGLASEPSLDFPVHCATRQHLRSTDQVDGEVLRERLTDGGVSPSRAVRYSPQIARGPRRHTAAVSSIATSSQKRDDHARRSDQDSRLRPGRPGRPSMSKPSIAIPITTETTYSVPILFSGVTFVLLSRASNGASPIWIGIASSSKRSWKWAR